MLRASLLFVPFALAFSLQTESADACSCAQVSGVQQSLPADGAMDVPTDVVPWVAGGPDATLLDAAGAVVETETRQLSGEILTCSQYVELVPAAPLAPNSTYTITAGARFVEEGVPIPSVSFTTGSGPLDAAPPAMPEVDVAFFETSAFPGSTCGSAEFQGCLFTAHDGLLDIRTRDRLGVESRELRPATAATTLYITNLDSELCASIRARDITGRTSDAVEVCANAADVPSLSSDNLPGYPMYGFVIDCSSEGIAAVRSGMDVEDPEAVGVVDAGAPENVPQEPLPTESDVITPDEGANPAPPSEAGTASPQAGLVAVEEKAGGCSVGLGGSGHGTAPLLGVVLGLGLIGVARRRR